VTRDGASIPQTAWGTAGAIDPGRHTIEARAPGYRQWSTTVLIGAENDDRVVTVPALEQELSPLPPAAPTPSLVPVGPSAAPSAKNEHADEPTSTHRIIGGSVVGAGAMTVIVGLIEYLNGRSKIDQAVSTATSGIERNDRALYSTAQPMLEEGVTHRDLGGVLLGVGSAAIAAGVVVLLIAPSQAPADTPARVAVWTGARAGGLRWTATW